VAAGPGSAFFVASLIHVPLGPSSVHLILGGVADYTTMVIAFIVPLAAYCVVWCYARKMLSVARKAQ
jgi:FHS family L-fucose permease-like MFS transporter